MNPDPSRKSKRIRLGLAVGALGVVFGDIGTSPLYVIRECFRHEAVTEAAILGVGSLLFWSLTLLVSIKYVTLLLNATSHGEGGIFALFSICRGHRKSRSLLMAGGAIAGAALLYGDGMITPAISVLSAVEGLGHFFPNLDKAVLPITCGVLASLFFIQRIGTGRIGRSFGMVMIVWFLTIGILGIYQVIQNPAVLKGLHPTYGIQFIFTADIRSLSVLGGVLLCITGAEALYADVGHFGKTAVRLSWWGVAKPCLLASYFGQLAWLMQPGGSASAIVNPIFAIVPDQMGGFFVFLATVAAVIASQALISGVFSLTEQGIRLGFLPRLTVVHTSVTERGQVFLPAINYILMFACIGLVLLFRNSDRLANAYGLAVLTGMIISSCFFFVYVRRKLRWPMFLAVVIVGIWLALEIGFFVAASTKFLSGAWIPAVFTVALFLVMQTWRWGEDALKRIDSTDERISLSKILSAHESVPRIGGASAVMISSQTLKPELTEYVERFRALPERLLLLSIENIDEAKTTEADRFHLALEAAGVHSLVVRTGFAERPDISAAVRWAHSNGSAVAGDEAIFFGFRRILIPQERQAGEGLWPYWERLLFTKLYRSSVPAWKTLNLPSDRVVEIGVREHF